MMECVFAPGQSNQLLAAIERAYARRAKRRPVPTDVGRWEEGRLICYIDRVKRRRCMEIDEDGYGFMFHRDDDAISLRLICVHDCGSCVYYLYTLRFNEQDALAREVLGHVSGDPGYAQDSYVRFAGQPVFAGLSA